MNSQSRSVVHGSGSSIDPPEPRVPPPPALAHEERTTGAIGAARLANVSPDLMTLHTREAYWMFRGRARSATQSAVVGGQRAAAVLNGLRRISTDGNPYADWFLVLFEQRFEGLRTELDGALERAQQRLDELGRRGLVLQILASPAPLQVRVGFGSAYGYAIAELIVGYDAFVRRVKTLVLKNRISADAGHAELRRVGRPIRGLFAQVLRWERSLQDSSCQAVRRRDYLHGSGEDATRRVRAALERFGPLPEEILSRSVLPRHMTHRSRMLGDAGPVARASSADPRTGAVELELI